MVFLIFQYNVRKKRLHNNNNKAAKDLLPAILLNKTISLSDYYLNIVSGFR